MASIELSEPYSPRPIRFLELAEEDGWRVKVYGISVHNEQPEAHVVTAAKRLAFERLPIPATGNERYGAAILIVHEAQEGNFVLVDWWFGENMLKNYVYFSSLDDPTAFEDISASGTMACVWELRVLSFERQAWLETVLANHDKPDLDAYFSKQLNEDI